MTICIGLKLADRIILAADSRRTLFPEGDYTDNYQKVKRISGTCWTVGTGNVSLCSYLADLMAEFQPHDLTAYLQLLRSVAQVTFTLQTSVYKALKPDYELMVALLIAGYDLSQKKLRLIGFSSADDFMPTDQGSGVVGGTTEDQEIVRQALGGAASPGVVKDRIKETIRAVSLRNPQIGPHGHIVSVSPQGSELEAF